MRRRVPEYSMHNKNNENPVSVFFVDPMAYHNLAVYDVELLSHLDRHLNIHFYANEEFNLSVPGILVEKIYRYTQKTGLPKIVSYLKSQLKLFLDIRREKPDIVHFQWFKIPPLDYLLLVLIKKYSRVVYTSHDVFSHDNEKRFRRTFHKIFKLADEVVVHTRTDKDKLATIIAPDKITVIKHGLLDLEKHFKNVPDTGQIKEKLGIKTEIVFSALGTMNPYKGTDLIIRAWQSSAALSNSRKAKLIIAGRNKMGLTKEMFRQGNIIFIDRYIPNGEFIALIRISNLILMPYRSISQSGLLLSALAVEKKILVSQAGELTEPFRHGNIGWVVNQNDVGGLRAALEEILVREQDLTRPVDPAIWRGIREQYGWEDIGAKTSLLYLRTARGKSISKQADGQIIETG